MNKKLLALLIMVLAVAACDAKKVPDAASEEDCQVYFKEVAQTCNESIYDGLDISCSTAVMSAKVAFTQQQGELFKDPNGKVSASKIGDAICASNLRSLRKERNKAVTEPKKNWGPMCTSFMEGVVSTCITPMTKGEFGNSCTTVLSSINSLKQNESPESMCESLSAMLPK